ncbi:AAA-like domain-containing protein [Pseudomonas chengduensis]|nr:AAA-like domain-containing protein [Pseudomonas chengduensis]KJU79812.1 hypothetical protein N619_08045 [Pseudomonas oleovorans]MDH1561351.1 AAA-like domain-containing protein [Pseudomonas chengduensis]MDH1729613.1 AAA-like domain-containing protein [Pseudomonas chengduensis]
MTNRVLKPCTIIPEELYIERAADRQLRAIIDDMGRPGYILVARQMGKTNLLINMKRQRHDDIVLYLDLSNRFDSARLWFRNLIDTLIDSYIEIFESSLPIISSQRKSAELEANVEFDRHLRLLLRSTEKRVVIVLDEIDSLVGCSYSDIVLAQIRSMYFSRVNYAEYSRLTYVLSGVAEPTDLIKDKNISPFNIGEKIYLEDFDWAEFTLFIEKSRIEIDEKSVKRIYHWTNGNPRMTWDLTSEIEMRLLRGEPITAQVIDEAVNKLYLKDYDRAPVDHIRTLVSSDPQIRSAVISIRYGNSEFPDDKIKGRLYLAGITSAAGGSSIKIRNNIFDEALSNKWIEQVDAAEKSMIDLAVEAFEAKSYETAIRLYDQARNNLPEGEELPDDNCLELGLSHLWLGKTETAIREFESLNTRSQDLYIQQLANFYLGSTLLSDRRYKDSYAHLLKASNGPEWSTRINSKINIVSVHLKDDAFDDTEKAIALSDSVIQEILDYGKSSDDIQFLLVSALYNKALILKSIGLNEDALSVLNEAISQAHLRNKPFLIMEKSGFLDNTEEKQAALSEYIDVLVSGDIDLEEFHDSTMALKKESLAAALCEFEKIGDLSQFDRLLRFVADKYYRSRLSVTDALIDLYETLKATEDKRALLLLSRGGDSYLSECNSPVSRIKFYRALATETANDKTQLWKSLYINELESSCPAELIEEADFLAIIMIMFGYRSAGQNDEFCRGLDVWRKFETKARVDFPVYAALILFYDALYRAQINNHDEASSKAEELITFIGGLEESSTPNSEVFGEIKKQAFTLLRNKVSRSELDPYREIGRNQKVKVKYADGQTVERKFKHVAADLKEGRCELLRSL